MTSPSTRHRSFATPVLAALVVVLVAAFPAISAAGPGAPTGDPSAERERVRAERAELASQVDALRADTASVERALSDLEANVAGQKALLAEAQRAAAEAREAAQAARKAERAAQARIQVLESKVRELAVDAFIHPPSDAAYEVIESESINDAAQRSALIDLGADRDADVLDQLEAAREDREIQRRNAEAALAKAEEKEAEVADRLDKVRAARDEQAAFAAQVQSRLDSALAESAHLAEVDAELAREIAAQQAALARRVAAARPSSGGGGGGSYTSGNIKLASASCPTGGSITVNQQIVDNTQALLDAANGDGVPLCGWGYRDSSAQIALREAHCGSSEYDIYQKPSYECSPPTAPPGTSMHEQGLAIDFTYQGSAISSQDSPAFRWLAANGASYGFYNLPSEPWHWSVNGN